MDSNFLNYTNLSYDEIKSGFAARMAQDPRFSNFTESQLYTVLSEIFAASTDFTNYYISRRAEESFLDSAKLRSSVTMLSKMLGYVVQRPIPATTSIQIKIKSKGASPSPVFTLPKGTSFTFGGLNYVLKESITYTLTQSDINNFTVNPNYSITLEFIDKNAPGVLNTRDKITDENKKPIYLIQGDFVTYELAPSDNNQVNTRYQTYKISDKTFSNLYGSEDYGYNNTTGEFDVIANFTRVGVAPDISTAFSPTSNVTDFNNSGEYYIDRRSFLNDATFPALTAKNSGASSKWCVIRTSMDDSVEVLFADDNIGKIGPRTNQTLFVKYLSTKGAAANQVGVAGKLVFCQTPTFGTFTQTEVEFYLRKNITGGADIETIDSMKVNAPGIFYSLDRCVSKKDYINFLKTLISPIVVKNAIAWGEQEETADKVVPNIRMFNVVLFSILASMYNKTTKNNQVVYDGLTTESYKIETNNNDWFDLLVVGDSTTPLRDENFESGNASEDLSLIYEKLANRSQVTVKNVYISPIIKDLKISGYVYLNALADRLKTNEKITNEIYAYLDENADFDEPVYISNLIELIEQFPEVHHADIKLTSNDEFNVDSQTFYKQTSATFSDISASYNTDPIGKVYNEEINSRTISSPYYVSSQDIYRYVLSDMLKDYSANTREAIILLLPQLETITYKENPSENLNQRFVGSEIVWPSKNIWNKKYCRVGLSTDVASDLITDFVPSERNFYLGMMRCVLNKLKYISSESKINSTTLDYMEGYLSNKDNCVGCSLRKASGAQSVDGDFADTIFGDDLKYISLADPFEITDFINTKFSLVVDMFRSSFLHDLQEGVLDSYTNAVNYTIKNEIARIKAPSLEQYVYYR